jgi:hypothetical protein
MDRVCSTNAGEKRKSEGKRPLATPRRRWVDNINMDLSDPE